MQLIPTTCTGNRTSLRQTHVPLINWQSEAKSLNRITRVTDCMIAVTLNVSKLKRICNDSAHLHDVRGRGME